MDNLSAYLERLELIAFFSGFPLLYALIIFIAGPAANRSEFKHRVVALMPYSYAIAGFAYWGFLLNNWYPDYSIGRIWNEMEMPLLKLWAMLSIVFCIPLLARKAWLCLLHSLPFVYLVIADLFRKGEDVNIVSNDMKLYTDSLLLQAGSLLLVFIIVMIYRFLHHPRPELRH